MREPGDGGDRARPDWWVRDWAGPVSWWIDNTGIIRVSKALARKGVGPYGWTKMGDRDVAGYLEWLDTRGDGYWVTELARALGVLSGQ